MGCPMEKVAFGKKFVVSLAVAGDLMATKASAQALTALVRHGRVPLLACLHFPDCHFFAECRWDCSIVLFRGGSAQFPAFG